MCLNSLVHVHANFLPLADLMFTVVPPLSHRAKYVFWV
jgi:hypothetical protein